MNSRSQPRVRLGHAARSESGEGDDTLSIVLGLLEGSRPLTSREPASPDAVRRAEQILGADPRPIYAFIGLLHPQLGTVGLIVSPAWAVRSTQGISRCDSGGLAGQVAGFGCIQEPETCLLELSYKDAQLAGWIADFQSEMEQSYIEGEVTYVVGHSPDYSTWVDSRARCIEYASKNGLLDRRLWTWEARLNSSPRPKEVEALVISPEMRKRLERLRRGGRPVPDSCRILSGWFSDLGVHWFDTTRVHAAFLGEST